MEEIVSNPKYPRVPRVTAIKPITGFRVHFIFADGVEKDIDLEPYLQGPIFEPIRQDPALFAAMYVDGDTIAWHNGADIDPDTLYYEGPPPWAEEHEQSKKTVKRRMRHVAPKRVRQRKTPVRARSH